jgi:hypothetical protein
VELLAPMQFERMNYFVFREKGQAFNQSPLCRASRSFRGPTFEGQQRGDSDAIVLQASNFAFGRIVLKNAA